METYLGALGYDVCDYVVSGNTSTNELRRYNSKSMNVILNVLPNYLKENFGQCSTTKILWEWLHNLHSKKHAGQYIDLENHVDPNDDSEEVEGMSKIEFQNKVMKVIKEPESQREKEKFLEAKLETTKECVEEINKKNEINAQIFRRNHIDNKGSTRFKPRSRFIITTTMRSKINKQKIYKSKKCNGKFHVIFVIYVISLEDLSIIS